MGKGANSKDKLVKAAVDLFFENGIHWVSFLQIAQKVGLSQPSLYKHFADKDELIRECALYAAMQGRTIIDANIDPYSSARDQVFAYIEGNFLWLRDHPKEGSIILAIYYFGFNNKSIQDVMIAINTQSVDRLAMRIAAGAREKLWAVDDFRKTGRVIHDILVGEMFKAIHTPGEIEFSDRLNMVWEAVQRLLPAPIGTP